MDARQKHLAVRVSTDASAGMRSTASLHLRAYIAGDDSRDEAQHRFDVSIRSIERTDACEEGGNETRHRRAFGR